ncbi:hypothetical protein FACS1894198_3530 [Clostridia bacterium]|nr:hypothetical protein FACS1894198_3530 [Clostridia bacterium]
MQSFKSRQMLRKILGQAATLCLLVTMSGFASCLADGISQENIEEPELEEPLISIIIPVYNVKPRYLKECLESVINQTFKRIEIICVDDGSTDGSLKILKKFAKKDKRIKVIHQKNKGPSAARNTGIDQALKSNSKYILFVDSDDILAKKACKVLVAAATKDDDIDMVAFNFQVFPNSPTFVWWKDVQDEIYRNDIDANISIIARAHYYLWDKFYKKDIFKEVRLIDDISYSEDVCFNLMVLPRVKCLKCISDKLYFYRVDNKNSLSKITNQEKRHDDTLKIMKYVCDDWRELGSLNAHKKALLNILADEVRKYRYDNRDYTADFINAFGEEFFNAKTIKKLPKDTQGKLRTLCKQMFASITNI